MTLNGYKDLRHNSAYTQILPTDEHFLLNDVNLELPELQETRLYLEKGNIEAARDAFLKLIASTSRRRYYFDISDVPQLMKVVQSKYSRDQGALRDIAEADRIVQGDLPIFKEHRVVFPDNKYDWNSWLYDSSQYQLHLTRFVYLKRLSRAYCLTGNEKYAQCFNDMMEHFIDDNPVPKDGTFRGEHCTWDPLSVGVRLFQIPEAFVTFFGSASFKPEVKMKMIKSFLQHGNYVRAFHASDGNHVCMQMRGLIQVALLLPELKASSAWLDYALRELPAFIRQNVFDDGVQIEASPNYHVIVMRDLYELVSLFQRLDVEAPEIYKETLVKMLDVLIQLRTPDGQLLRFGDTDKTDEREIRNIFSTGAYLFGRGDLKYLGYEELPFALLWRFGPEAIQPYKQIVSEQPVATSADFRVGGYLVSRENWQQNAMYAAMRAGKGIGGHAHSDALSVILFAGGRELIRDSGMGLFEWNRERKYAVSTRAHNTIVVDEQDQHVRGMHWSTQQTAACKIWDIRNTGAYDYWFASHYGYTRFTDPVIHSRKVLHVKNRYWLIVDILEADKDHKVEQYFHLPTGDVIGDWKTCRIRTNDPEANVMLVFPEQKAEDAQLVIESGLNYRLGKYEVSPVVKRTIQAAGRTILETLIVPYGKEVPVLEVTRLPVHRNESSLTRQEVTALQISGEGWMDEICLSHDSVEVATFLDHTGNPVAESLLPSPVQEEEIRFGQKRYQDDLIFRRV